MPASPAIERRRAAPLRAFGHRADEDLELCVALEQDLGHAHMVTDADLGSQRPATWAPPTDVRAARGCAYNEMAMQTTTKRPQSSLLRRELEETLREVDAALRAMGSGDHESYAALWDDGPDVTLFGAWGPIERGTRGGPVDVRVGRLALRRRASSCPTTWSST